MPISMFPLHYTCDNANTVIFKRNIYLNSLLFSGTYSFIFCSRLNNMEDCLLRQSATTTMMITTTTATTTTTHVIMHQQQHLTTYLSRLPTHH